MRINCKTQAECDAALVAKNIPVLIGDGWFRIQGQSHVVARESSRVVAWGSSHVVARESSHVVAWESSHVEARESSHVEARESSHVEARESSHVVASKFVATHIHSTDAKVKGGVRIVIKTPTTPKSWCEYYGAKVEKGFAILFKAVDNDFRGGNKFLYRPGTTPQCDDWNPIPECGGGLHFCATPLAAKAFYPNATRFVACLVKLSDIVVHKNASSPQKVKAPRISKPIYEVDMYGNPIGG
jgi:hypothetical protein